MSSDRNLAKIAEHRFDELLGMVGDREMLAKLLRLISDGEGLTAELKRCTSELTDSVFETVSSFSNRYGGHILLGVEDNGTISGVNSQAVTGIKKHFANTLNNTQRFSPTLFLALEETEIDGKTVLWCYVLANSQVVMFNGRIYDRTEGGDIDITRNSAMVAHIPQRKAADYSERKIFPYAKESDFEFARLLALARRLAVTHRMDHPWERMSDSEIVKSAGLFQTDPESGKSGYTLAAILLFGREELIRACTPNYITDAICRRENLDRYDDRLMVTSNLIDAYDQLIEFVAKHTLDRFFLIDSQRVSVRSWIARELVSNILVHREYTSAYPAKIIIERDRIATENWCLPKSPGKIDPNAFTPYPKNPLLANFFVNIGRADMLGSGVRNLYKYTKIYSGGEPELVEGDVFRTIVPLELAAISVTDNVEMSDKTSDNSGMPDNAEMSDKTSDNSGMPDNAEMSDKTSDNSGMPDNAEMSDKTSDNSGMPDNVKMSDKFTVAHKKHRAALLAHLADNDEVSASEAATIIAHSTKTARRTLLRLVDEGIVETAGGNRNRTYKMKRQPT
ncbi:MAG: putative DNA binding domain-containing protein [Deltaproteobacteria bacterium]|nr:putative DNA binding domain-containing protein [Deltaproteobacteria bacterium]